MNSREWAQKNNRRRDELLREKPKTQSEKDVWNLKLVLYSINKDSRWYRLGMVKTLQRTVKSLEAANA
jgi:hypothetical protein